MRVTILADASFCPDYHVGGYGFWIVCERGKYGGGGSIKNTVPSSVIAEMMAVVNALHQGLKVGLVMKGDDVLMQTDCMGAINFLSRMVRGLPPDHMPIAQAWYDLRTKNDIRVMFKHVKAHTGLTEARYIANKMCDKRAKKGMRLARAEARRVADV